MSIYLFLIFVASELLCEKIKDSKSHTLASSHALRTCDEALFLFLLEFSVKIFHSIPIWWGRRES